MTIKMYNVFALESVKKMNGIRGKMVTQGQHACLHSFWDAERRFPEMAQEYRDTSHAYKINLVVETVEDLIALQDAYRDVCGVSLVKDAGFTVFKNEDGTPCPTITTLGIGPIRLEDIGDDLKALKTFT